MGSGRSTQLWLLGFLAFSSLAEVSSVKVMSAPNLMGVGRQENIFVECQDCTTEDIRVEISVMNHPTKNKRLAFTSVTLNALKKFQDFAQITIPPDDFRKDPNVKQYVYLKAEFPGVRLEKVVLVTFHTGYIYIQTDKPLYTPNSKVMYRIFALTPSMEPVEGNQASVDIEIVTADGIVITQEQLSVRSGLHSGAYQLGDIISPGQWKVVAKFQSSPQKSFSAEFEVKEYVLPSFEVKLTSENAFFNIHDSQELTINIKVTYLFGEEVDGMAYVVFGLIYQNQKKGIPNSLQRVVIANGEGVVTLRKEHITATFPDIQELVGSSIYVAVSVVTESGSEMVEAELRDIPIVKSQYTITFKKTAKYFKPGMSFDVLVEVENPDTTPVHGATVVLTPGGERGLTGTNGMARLSVNTNNRVEPLTITVDVQGVSHSTASITVHPYNTKSNSYIHIEINTAEVGLGDNMRVNIILNQHANAKKHITYLILSRGQLLQYGQYMPNSLISMNLIITKDMLPSFRIIAYYFTNDNEVVSDSVWVDVKDTCMGSLKLEQKTFSASYLPRKYFDLRITGDPGATVGLVAVDKGVYVLNNKHRLTQKKVWDLVEMFNNGCTPGGGSDSMNVFYDAGLLFESSTASGTPYRQDLLLCVHAFHPAQVWDLVEMFNNGCTPGGGSDSMNVFYDAGLLFESSTASGTPYRQELQCPTHSRRRRAKTILDVRTNLASQYEDKNERDCCLEGMATIPVSYTCERRSEYIGDDAACVAAFLHCCNQMEIQRAERQEDELLLARSEDTDSYLDSDVIASRTHFPESWQWSELKLPLCSRHQAACTQDIRLALKDSITTWQFIGISLSRTHGICVANPLDIIVRKDFFIDLKLPYSAVRGEQIEIKAVLHNYSPDKITVRLDLLEEQHVCSSASRKKRYRQEVDVGEQTTRAIPFIIIPMREGKLFIEVKGSVKDTFQTDGVKKPLLVVPEGMLKRSLKSETFNPAEEGVGGRQEKILSNEIPEKDVVPNTPTRTEIFVTGREQLSALVENALSGKSMGSLIKQPSGCGEQNMISMTLPVIATLYLDKTNQWETVGFEKREDAIEHIKTGYTNELAYRKSDGSFAVFQDHKSSTWLTAYVVKVFAMAYNLVAIPSHIVCDAVNFLILHTQQQDGMFTEVGSIIHGEMIGDVRGADSDASMTAFCLIAMQESRQLCNTTINNLGESISNAVNYLKRRLPNLQNSYAAAMTSYALANEKQLDRRILSKFISSGSTHWPVRDSHLFTLEATAYGLLALVKAKAFNEARPVVRWFNQQQIDGGGYGSTQATIIVYQAIAEYWINAHEEDYDVNLDIVIPGRQKIPKINFNKDNHYVTRTSKVNKINQNVTVIATGTGEATVKMVSMYYALPEERESDCQKFNLSVQLIPDQIAEEKKTYKLIIEFMYKNKEREATMTILDIGLLTGYTINTDDLKILSTGRARIISKYEVNKILTEKGSLIIYLDKVSNTQTSQIAFRIHETMKVGVLQPAAVSVYEYYDHQLNNQAPCVKFYRPERKQGELLRLCLNDECACAEENCSMQKKEKVPNSERTLKVCETEEDNSIDFVYKARLEDYTEELFTDIYTVHIVDVIKEGSYDVCRGKPGNDKKTCDVGPLNKTRSFLGYPHCKEALNLQKGKTYLVMGTARDIHIDKVKQSYQYVFGERTWIEYWPTEEECQTKEHRPTCLGLEEMKSQYLYFGCRAK